MALITQPLRDEHKGLLPKIELLKATADAIAEGPTAPFAQAVEGAYHFLMGHLLPHAKAEDKALYPVVAKVMGSPKATMTMSRDHAEVERLIEALERLLPGVQGKALNKSDAISLRRVLYGLHAIIKLHFAKEEEVYLPLLDASLNAAEAKAMFAAMHMAADEAGAHHH